MDFNLDFTIETSNDRRDFIASKDLSKLNKNISPLLDVK